MGRGRTPSLIGMRTFSSTDTRGEKSTIFMNPAILYKEIEAYTGQEEESLVVFPTSWDQKLFRREIGTAPSGSFRSRAEAALQLQIALGFRRTGVHRQEVASGRTLDGVFSSSDYPGAFSRARSPGGSGFRAPPAFARPRELAQILLSNPQREAVPTRHRGSSSWTRSARRRFDGAPLSLLHQAGEGAFSVMSQRSTPGRTWIRSFRGRRSRSSSSMSCSIGWCADSPLRARRRLLHRRGSQGRLVTVEIRHREHGRNSRDRGFGAPRMRSFVRFDYPSSRSAGCRRGCAR
jgi:hypothetical protein